MEGYFELVVDALVGAGYRWYETSSFCRPGRQARTTSATGAATTIWASASVQSRRSTACAGSNRASLNGYLTALGEGRRPPRDEEPLGPEVASRERLMLGLRLDEPFRSQASKTPWTRRPSCGWSGSGWRSGAGTVASSSLGAGVSWVEV